MAWRCLEFVTFVASILLKRGRFLYSLIAKISGSAPLWGVQNSKNLYGEDFVGFVIRCEFRMLCGVFINIKLPNKINC